MRIKRRRVEVKAGKLLALVVFLVAVAGAANAQLANSPWPMFHHDLNHTGRSPYLGAGEGNLKWSFPSADGGGIYSSPVIGSDGTIYFGSRPGNSRYFYALYPNGTLKWNFSTGGVIRSSPAIGSDGTIYFGSSDGYLYAIADLTPPRVSIISPQNTTYGTSTVTINVSVGDPSGVLSSLGFNHPQQVAESFELSFSFYRIGWLA
ncbi:MAG: PQQ-like beta-propeller repeat protein, partial [Euryarchaeota archaeon]|nr:PQQ-like beta-propeller repeat protein [Euryarchaeota archaeon]